MVTTEYPEDSIRITDGTLIIDGYEERDTTIVAHFERLAPDVRADELHRVLVIGTYAADAVPGSLTFRDVAEDAERATQAMQRMVQDARKSTEDAIQQQADVMKRALSEELAKYASPDRSTSIPATVEAKVKAIVEAGEKAMKEQLDAALNVVNEGSPLAQIFQKLHEVSGNVQAMLARRDERQAGAHSKGDDYQTAVFEEIARIASVHGDSAEFTANIEGEGGTKAGDITVSLNHGLTAGREVRIVFEAMDREAKGNPKARLDCVLVELEGAARNRVALSAVAVASTPAIPATGGQRLHEPRDGRFVAVYEKEQWDPLTLEVAYCSAKIAALRSCKEGPNQGADLARAGEIVARLVARTDDFGKLQGNLRDGQGAFLKSIDVAERLKADLQTDLATLQALLLPPADMVRDKDAA